MVDGNIIKAHIMRALCKALYIKYGYNEKECQAYLRGYRDCEEFMNKRLSLDGTGKEYIFQIEIDKEDE